jgi:N-acetylmuramate 1-kinase
MSTPETMVQFAQKSLGLAQDAAVDLIPLEGRGSDRAYYRFLWGPGNSAILVHYKPSRIENTYYADIALFLSENHIPVPQIICHDAVDCFILMEDLGNTDLWTLRNESWEVRKGLYQKTMKTVYRLHSLSETQFPSDRVRLTEAFGPNLYKWERDYFKVNFLEGLCALKLEPSLSLGLETELADLADRLSSGRRSLVHRDLQSQNVMIYADEPFLIDFQGMRFGTRFYDLGSILCDPYVNFSGIERIELLSFYHGLSESAPDWVSFQNAFWEASAQRLMQALGAYGFLGLKKGFKGYLRHVPAAVQNLRMAAANAGSLPTLLEVCAWIDSRFQIPDSGSNVIPS